MAAAAPVAAARAALLVAAIAALTGCFWRRDIDAPDCRMVQEYQESGTLPPLQTPEGMARAPSTPVRIPDAQGEFDPATVGCLERPPNYFNRPISGQPGGEPVPPPPGSGPQGPSGPSPGPPPAPGP
jgi:hypothetical protein